LKREGLHNALQDGLDALALGQDLEAALGIHPGHSADVRPALEAALALRALPAVEVPTKARNRSRARLRAALPSARRGPFLGARWVPRLAAGVAAVVLALTAGFGGLVAASAQALPGDSLYPFKRASEAVQLRLTFTSRARMTLEEQYSVRRADEVRRLLALGRIEKMTFEGIVQAQADTGWLVADIRVVVPPEISVTPGILPGMTIEVRGETQTEGHFLAKGIRLLGFQFVAPVLSMGPEEWTVGEHSFRLLPDTWIEPGIRTGEVVLVSVRFLDSGEPAGRAVLRLRGEALPTSTSLAPSPLPTLTPEPGGDPEGPDDSPSADEDEALETDEPRAGDNSGPGGNSGGSPTSEATEAPDGEEVKFEGVVESRSASSWVISGTVVHVDSNTEIRDDPQVGDTVKVEAVTQPNGQLLATKIEKED
jgi:hypothetical protein